MYYTLNPDNYLRVRHSLFREEIGTVTGFYVDGKLYVEWDKPGTLLNFRCSVFNLVFRVKAPSRPCVS